MPRLRFEIWSVVETEKGLEAGSKLGEARDDLAADVMAEGLAEAYGAGVLFPVIHDRQGGTWNWGDWSDEGAGPTVTKQRKVSWRTLNGGRATNKPLTAAQRDALPASDFGLRGTRDYPIDTRARARSALARGSEYLPSRKLQELRRRVQRKYPAMRVRGINPAKLPKRVYIIVDDEGDIGEGPWRTKEAAEVFMHAEVSSAFGAHVVAVRPDQVEDMEYRGLDDEEGEYGDNPGVMVLANPPRHGRVFGRVERIWYQHEGKVKGPYVHKFGPGVKVEGLDDGSLRIFHPTKRVWEDDGR